MFSFWRWLKNKTYMLVNLFVLDTIFDHDTQMGIIKHTTAALLINFFIFSVLGRSRMLIFLVANWLCEQKLMKIVKICP